MEEADLDTLWNDAILHKYRGVLLSGVDIVAQQERAGVGCLGEPQLLRRRVVRPVGNNAHGSVQQSLRALPRVRVYREEVIQQLVYLYVRVRHSERMRGILTADKGLASSHQVAAGLIEPQVFGEETAGGVVNSYLLGDLPIHNIDGSDRVIQHRRRPHFRSKVICGALSVNCALHHITRIELRGNHQHCVSVGVNKRR